MAIVLRALEVRAQAQEAAIRKDEAAAGAVVRRAREEASEWADLASLVGGPAAVESGRALVPPQYEQPVGSLSWSDAFRDARANLIDAGIDPDSVKLVFPDALSVGDVAAAIGIGALGAVTPSLGGESSVRDGLNQLQKAADKGGLPDAVQMLFGTETPAAFMDAGAAGPYHRFVHGHDLFWALPEGIKSLGILPGISQVFQHLLRDVCGLTGIPLPGSTMFAESIAANMGIELRELVSPRDLSRYTGLRMTDVAATGTTSLLLWVYGKLRGIEGGSIRAAKLGILAHGFCFAGIAVASLIPGLAAVAAHRSHLNYVSLVALAKNGLALSRATRTLRRENARRFDALEAGLRELETLRQSEAAELLDDQFWAVARYQPGSEALH
jgi:hypothetical protein